MSLRPVIHKAKYSMHQFLSVWWYSVVRETIRSSHPLLQQQVCKSKLCICKRNNQQSKVFWNSIQQKKCAHTLKVLNKPLNSKDSMRIASSLIASSWILNFSISLFIYLYVSSPQPCVVCFNKALRWFHIISLHLVSCRVWLVVLVMLDPRVKSDLL